MRCHSMQYSSTLVIFWLLIVRCLTFIFCQCVSLLYFLLSFSLSTESRYGDAANQIKWASVWEIDLLHCSSIYFYLCVLSVFTCAHACRVCVCVYKFACAHTTRVHVCVCMCLCMWIDREADNSKANPQRSWQDEVYSSLLTLLL